MEKIGATSLLHKFQQYYENILIFDIPEITLKNKLGHDYCPESLSVIKPEVIPKFLKYFKKLDKETYNIWLELWMNLCKENKLMRTKGEDGQIRSTN